jgi:hypothetical protein
MLCQNFKIQMASGKGRGCLPSPRGRGWPASGVFTSPSADGAG